MKKLITTAILATVISQSVNANNIQVSNVSISGQNTTANTTQINFNVAWDNSWRTSTNESNYDGAWIFVKFRKHGTSLWQHATINYNATSASAAGHTQPASSIIKSVPDKKGAFIYRSTNFIGNVSYTGASLRWNYGEDGVLDNDSVEVKVMAIEMVYIPQGSYYLGSGGTEYNAFKKGGTSDPYLVSSNDAITVGGDSNLVYNPSTVVYSSYGYPTYWYGGDVEGPITVQYPKGFNSFWIMKYECSQQQYADFLNLLDNSKANTRNVGIYAGSHPNFTANQPERAMHNASMIDLIAYADWCGLRPMSELEYEKACRGSNIVPIANEYAWGNTSITNISSISNLGASNEKRGAGNCNYGSSNAYRCGIFANDTTTRVSAGATYYGVMEMTGNVEELTVSVGSAQGRALLDSVHGDGTLAANGSSNIPTWTSIASSQSVSIKGGNYGTGTGFLGYLTISGRYQGISDVSVRAAGNGIRLVRTGN